ncbi:hypothetical protein PAQ31011_02415 [Pandoraea aquatica]|uniref:Uncharacterized protein n=1 Tax=Pandoraea aquatica TaxID=2508290 RepID=A0A5E4V2D8_9BURK|nr:hypothetical protein [Pandoraea aquatica]VVE06376.1 hypothetical protein PAQ31011_02415 [Pandoraea aquatica]
MSNSKSGTTASKAWNEILSGVSIELKTPEHRPDVGYFTGDTLFSDADGNRMELYDFQSAEVVCPMHLNEVVLCRMLVERNYSTGFYCPKCVKTYWAIPDWHVTCRQCGIPDSMSAMYEYGFCYNCYDPDEISGFPNGEPMQ